MELKRFQVVVVNYTCLHTYRAVVALLCQLIKERGLLLRGGRRRGGEENGKREKGKGREGERRWREDLAHPKTLA